MIKKTRLICSLLLVLLFLPAAVAAAEKEPLLHAKAAILIDSETGEVIFAKNADEKRQPASTTKILTAILAIECCDDLDHPVVVSKHAASIGESSINLLASDVISFNDLLHGALINSGNDACVALAEAIAPSEEEFVGMMNLKAKLLGAENTSFCSTNGLPADDHLTNAADLAVITRYALKNPVFAGIVNKKTYTLRWISPPHSRKIKNTNMLLWSLPQATGVKTGTTVKAGKCLVASASDGKREVITVVLNSLDRFGDAQRLLLYGLYEKGN